MQMMQSESTYTLQTSTPPSSPALITTLPPLSPSRSPSSKPQPNADFPTQLSSTVPTWPECSATSWPCRASHVFSLVSAEAVVKRCRFGAGCGVTEVMTSCGTDELLSQATSERDSRHAIPHIAPYPTRHPKQSPCHPSRNSPTTAPWYSTAHLHSVSAPQGPRYP